MDDREGRLQSAAELLLALRNCGMTQRFIAAYLRVSHSKLARWNRGHLDPKCKLGVPTDEQLRRLVALLQFQLADNFRTALMSYWECQFRPEGALLWFAIDSVLQEATADYRKAKKHRSDREKKTRKFARAVGSRDAKALLRPGIPDSASEPQTKAWREAKKRTEAETLAELAALRVAPEDAERARRELEQWRAEFQQRQRKKEKKRERPRRVEQEEGGSEQP